jgi:hypothetical protein
MRAMLADAPIRWIDPTTWPWTVDVWLAFILAGWAAPLWRWLQRRKASGWPAAEGRIESVEITKPNFSFTTKRGNYVAQLGYSYSIAGSTYSGQYKRQFPTGREAEEFVRDLQGKPVAVHYNPNNPSSSALLESDIEVLLRNRAPKPTAGAPSAANSVPDWTRPFLWFFVWFSAIGLVVSLWVHVGAVMGRPVSPFFSVLHVGIFVVWIPAVFVAQRLVGNVDRKDL